MPRLTRARAWLRGDHLPRAAAEWQPEDWLQPWARACIEQSLGAETWNGVDYPKLTQPTYIRPGVFGYQLRPARTQSLETIQKVLPALTNTLGVWQLLMRPTGTDSRAHLTIVMDDPFPTTVEWTRPDPGELAYPIAETLSGPPVMFSVGEDPASILVGGTRGFGKSSFARVMIAGQVWLKIHAGWQGHLYGIDLKRVELQPFRPAFDGLAVTPADAADLLRFAVTDMQDRYEYLERLGLLNIWQARDRDDWPGLCWLWVDEVQLLKGPEAQQALEVLATAGRAAGWVLGLLTQSPQVKVVESIIRDQLAMRAACRTADWRHTDTIMGGWSQVAPAHRLASPGLFYVQSDDARTSQDTSGISPVLAKAAWVSLEDVRQLVRPLAAAPLRSSPSPPQSPRPTLPVGEGGVVQGVEGRPSGPTSPGNQWAIRSPRPGGLRGHPLADKRGRVFVHRREHWERLGGVWSSEEGVTAEPGPDSCAGCGTVLEWSELKVGAVPGGDGSLWQPGDPTASWCGACVKGTG